MDCGTTFGASGYRCTDILLFRDAEGMGTLLADFPVFRVAQGEIVPAVVEGNALLYVVLKGALQVSASGEAGSGSIALPGECVGEFAVLGGERRGVQITATEPTDVLIIDAATLLRLIDESTGFAHKLLAMRVQNAYASVAQASDDDLDFDSLFEDHNSLRDRTWLEANLPRMTAEAHRSNQMFSTLMISLDYLSEFSASYGDAKVEEALKMTSDVIISLLRPSDFVARFSDTQLVVLLPEANLQGALLVATRLSDKMKKTAIVGESGAPVPLTASFGIACFGSNPAQGEHQADLIGASTAALARAKRSGRSNISV
jgi:diguanylate cyclase (GGDEF)-like protein